MPAFSPGRAVVTACSVETPFGVKVVDVARESEAFTAWCGDGTPLPAATRRAGAVYRGLVTVQQHTAIAEGVPLFLQAGAREV